MNEPVKRRKKPRVDDPAKEQRIAEVRRMLEEMRPPSPASRLPRATEFEGISLTNQFYLSGARFAEKPWSHVLWWAARDLAGNDVALEEVLDLLIDTADAWDDPERQDLAVRTIVNAFYFQPKVTAREYAQRRREGREVTGSLTDTGAPASQETRLAAVGSGPGTMAVPGPGKAPPSMDQDRRCRRVRRAVQTDGAPAGQAAPVPRSDLVSREPVPMCSLASRPPAGKGPGDPVDAREQPFNDRAIGPHWQVQVSAERVARLHGLVLDLDPALIRESDYARGMGAGPAAFYEQTVKFWLARHPVLAEAEVRGTGTGLHALIWFAEPVDFATDGQRRRWDGIVQAIQALLPVDPDQPGITTLTRPVGAINGKNGAAVERLKDGRPVPVEAVEHHFEQLRRAPFRIIMNVLVGAERVRPCPVCRAAGTTLSAGNHVGFCYGSCGQVKLGQLYEVFLAPRPTAGEEGAGSETTRVQAVKLSTPQEGDVRGAAAGRAAGAEAITEEGVRDGQG